jgi:sugar lactone lactonase YvrE
MGLATMGRFTNMALFMNMPETLSRSILVSMLGWSALLVACSDGGTTGSGGSAAATSSSESSASSGSGGGGGGSVSSSSSSGGVVAPQLKVVAQFAPLAAELPDGLAITPDGRTAYVGFVQTGKIVKVSLPDGKVTPFSSLSPAPGGYLLGLILDTNGDLFAAMAGTLPGVHKINKDTGDATLFVSDLLLTFPNGFGFMADGSLLVTDSSQGKIFKIDVKSKQLTPWVSHPLLLGDPLQNKCAEGTPAFAVGVNGITSIGDQVYVTNSDNAKIIQIPIKFDGTAGTPTELLTSDATSCAPLKGADGLTADEEGNLYLVGSTVNSLLRLPKGSTTVEKLIDSDGQLEFPTTVVLSKLDGKRYAYITNFAIDNKVKPSLVVYGPLP